MRESVYSNKQGANSTFSYKVLPFILFLFLTISVQWRISSAE